MEGKLRLPDQRAVAEQPDRLLLGEEGSFAIDMRRVDHDCLDVYADGLEVLRIRGWVNVWAMRTPASTSMPPTRWNRAMRSPRKAMAISALNSGIRLMKILAWLAPIWRMARIHKKVVMIEAGMPAYRINPIFCPSTGVIGPIR